jgi:ribosomal-protein-alanine N-acetyltransferase
MDAILQTPRLLLREMTLDDLDFVAEMLAHPEVMRFYLKRYTREEAQRWVQRQIDRYSRHGHGLWLVLEKATGRPVGQVGLVVQEVDGVQEPEVGYLIHRPYWRRGFAVEAAAATRDYGMDTLCKDRLISLIRPENLPSQGVARKIGMTPEKRTIHAGLEHVVFSIQRGTPRGAQPV